MEMTITHYLQRHVLIQYSINFKLLENGDILDDPQIEDPLHSCSHSSCKCCLEKSNTQLKSKLEEQTQKLN